MYFFNAGATLTNESMSERDATLRQKYVDEAWVYLDEDGLTKAGSYFAGAPSRRRCPRAAGRGRIDPIRKTGA